MKASLCLLVCLSVALGALPTDAQEAAQIVSLAGEWRFEMDRSAEQSRNGAGTPELTPGGGVTQAWFRRELPKRIQLPGILQAQGYGNEINPDTPWVTTLGDAWWKLQPAALRDHFSQPGKVKVPFLSQPQRHYLGVAWYQRDIVIPAAWQGRHLKLFLERPRWKTTVWTDEKEYPANDSLVAPHVTDLGPLAPGKHRLTIRIDNRTQLPATGHLVDGHSVSDSLGATWNGVAGRIELQAFSPVWIEDAQVYPNVAKKTALLKVRIGNGTGRAGRGTLSASGKSAPVEWQPGGGSAELEIPLGADAKTWDEFHPNLQRLTVALKGGGADDAKTIFFGLREVSWNDKDLLCNGRVINLRTTHSGGDFPLTGYPATDAESWKKIIKVCQDYGLNGMRFHSWCPPDAAFAAADEMGFYLQPECGMWNDFRDAVMQQRLQDETARLLQAYGNHPSFILLSPSNEPRNYARFTPQWAADWHKQDSRRLYSAGTGWSDPSQVNGGAQFAALVAFNRQQVRNATGWFGGDYRAALENVHLPVLAHEVGQWCAYPDFDIIKDFTGYLRPSNYDIFRYIAEQQGVLEYNSAFAFASGRFQLACYKEEIEANLRTPGLAGYQLLDLHDYLGQGTALIGLVDAFWKPKSYVTAQEFRQFNGETVPLVRLERRTYTTADTLATDAEIYHFAEAPIVNDTPVWKIVDANNNPVATGDWAARDIPIGKNIPLGRVSADLSKLPAPAAYKLVVGLQKSNIWNQWNFWLYPAQIDSALPKDVMVTARWADAEAKLVAGGSVLFLPGNDSLDASRSPAMQRLPVFWNIQMTVRPPQNPSPKFDAMLGLLCDPKHPALAAFPTDVNCDWQWTPLVSGVRSVNLSAAPRELKPIVAAIDDWNRNWRLGVIFECKVGPGKLLVSAIHLQDARATPGAQQLRRSLLDYMASEKFQPAAQLSPQQARQLWSKSAAPDPSATQRAFDPDLNDGSTPAPKP